MCENELASSVGLATTRNQRTWHVPTVIDTTHPEKVILQEARISRYFQPLLARKVSRILYTLLLLAEHNFQSIRACKGENREVQ